jgi:tetratricopeptide (TPR) repeat protein
MDTTLSPLERAAWLPWRTIAIAGGGLVLVALAAIGGWRWYESHQAQALAAFAEAMTRVQESRTPEAKADARAAAIRGLETTLAAYPSSAAATQATLELGNLKYWARDLAGARAAFEIALAKNPSPTVRTLARAGVGHAWEAERNFPNASAAFRSALEGVGPQDFLYEELMLDYARLQEVSGDKSGAIATYQRLLKELPSARHADDARTRLAALGVMPPR